MKVYNIIVKISEDFHDDWLEWTQMVLIPAVMKTGFLIENNMQR